MGLYEPGDNGSWVFGLGNMATRLWVQSLGMVHDRKHWLRCESKNCLKSVEAHLIHSEKILSEPEHLFALILAIMGLSSSKEKGFTLMDGGAYRGAGRGRAGKGMLFQIFVAKYSAMVSSLLVESHIPWRFLTTGGVG